MNNLTNEEKAKIEKEIQEIDKQIESIRKKRIELNSKLAEMNVKDYTLKDEMGKRLSFRKCLETTRILSSFITWKKPVLTALCGQTDSKTHIKR
ncbi:MAG: hypothetical protein R3A12_00065 [Ignavibacteria bacterium]